LSEQTVAKKKTSPTLVVAVVLIVGLLIGIPIGWLAKPAPSAPSTSELCAIPKSKFTNPRLPTRL